MNEYNKKPKVKKKRKIKISNIIFSSTVLTCVALVITFVVCSVITENKAKFTNDDWVYMQEYIEEEIGDGEEFVIMEKKTEKIRERYKQRADDDGVVRDYYHTVGVRAIVTGYFKSQEKECTIEFEKYIEDRPALKNGKAGTVYCVNDYLYCD